MDSLIDLDDLKRQVRIDHTYDDITLDELCVTATAIIINYLEAEDKVSTSPVEWDRESVPRPVKAAILEVATNLYRHRGDEGEQSGPITPRVHNLLLGRYRRPALA